MTEQVRIGEIGRRTEPIAKRPGAVPIELRIGKKHQSPASPDPGVKVGQGLGGLGARVRHEEEPLPGEAGRVGDADRLDIIALLDPAQRRRPSAVERGHVLALCGGVDPADDECRPLGAAHDGRADRERRMLSAQPAERSQVLADRMGGDVERGAVPDRRRSDPRARSVGSLFEELQSQATRQLRPEVDLRSTSPHGGVVGSPRVANRQRRRTPEDATWIPVPGDNALRSG